LQADFLLRQNLDLLSFYSLFSLLSYAALRLQPMQSLYAGIDPFFRLMESFHSLPKEGI
jgi:hypothetical protein